jgi:hypothetical protein
VPEEITTPEKNVGKKATKATQNNNPPAYPSEQSSALDRDGIQDGSASRDEITAPFHASLHDLDTMLD